MIGAAVQGPVGARTLELAGGAGRRRGADAVDARLRGAADRARRPARRAVRRVGRAGVASAVGPNADELARRARRGRVRADAGDAALGAAADGAGGAARVSVRGVVRARVHRFRPPACTRTGPRDTARAGSVQTPLAHVCTAPHAAHDGPHALRFIEWVEQASRAPSARAHWNWPAGQVEGVVQTPLTQLCAAPHSAHDGPHAFRFDE